jgi:hypothetical protein
MAVGLTNLGQHCEQQPLTRPAAGPCPLPTTTGAAAAGSWAAQKRELTVRYGAVVASKHARCSKFSSAAPPVNDSLPDGSGAMV